MINEVQGTTEYDVNLNKALPIPVGGSVQEGVISNLSTTNLSGGTLSGTIKGSKDLKFIIPDGVNDRVLIGKLN